MRVTKKLSVSPFGKAYRIPDSSSEKDKIRLFLERNKGRKVVVIQGLGFVGAAMLTAVAGARDKNGSALYSVIGVDLPTEHAYWKIGMINQGRLPLKCSDKRLASAFRNAFKKGNLLATHGDYAYEAADIIVMDINLDIKKYGLNKPEKARILLSGLISAAKKIAALMKKESLVIVESTVPPGTCQKILLPLFEKEFKKRGYKKFALNLAHSYERVMPGKNYLRSITSFYRVFSASNNSAAKKAKKFFGSFIDTKNFPLTQLHSVTASETAKIMENSFRAVNIAFIQEWTEFAEAAGVNLFEVIEGIRKRETHKNIMFPGFGVGGFCLPKDPLLGNWANRKLFNLPKRLEFSVNAVKTNDLMPLYSFFLLRKHLKALRNKRISLLGVSYLNDVADTRFSPSELFYRKCLKYGAKVSLHDPLVKYWKETGVSVNNDLRAISKEKADAVVLAINHFKYAKMQPEDFKKILKPKGLVLDCSNAIDDKKARSLRKIGFQVYGVGKGHWNTKESIKR